MSAYYPDKQEFARRARLGNLTPVYKEILADMETPVSAFKKIENDAYSFLLEKCPRRRKAGARPIPRLWEINLVIKSKGRDVTIIRNGIDGQTYHLDGSTDILHLLKHEFGKLSHVSSPHLPRFCGGAVGFIGYDTRRVFEDIPDTTVDDLNMPDCTLIFTDTSSIFDHVRHRIRVVCNAAIGDDPKCSVRAGDKEDREERRSAPPCSACGEL